MTDNALLMTLEEIAAASGGELYHAGKNAALDGQTAKRGIASVCIDSRKAEKNALFIALEGKADDGHRYVTEAYKRGAAAALVSREVFESGRYGLKDIPLPLLVVDNTLTALQDTSAAYLEKFPGLIRIGITGSAGKTTTKEIAAAIIGTEKKVVMNSGNLNSETGLPLAVFEVRSHHEAGIFEMGMNRRGEIAELARVLKPHIALITNIGTAHIGILGTKQDIAKEKKDIFSQFTGSETALIPASREWTDFLSSGVRGKIVYFGEAESNGFGGARDLGLEGTELIWEGNPVRFGLPGRHNLWNALAAASIARELPVSAGAVRKGLESVKPLFGRGEILHGPVTLVRDCYNANPEAVLEIIAFCDSVSWPGRRVYVIGSMLELGEYSRASHELVGKALASSKADIVFLFGSETLPAREAFTVSPGRGSGGPALFHTDSMEELIRLAQSHIKKGDLVLLKGSRGTELERLGGVFMSSPAKETA